MKELAELVEPHVWWSDGDWETTPDYWNSTGFLGLQDIFFHYDLDYSLKYLFIYSMAF